MAETLPVRKIFVDSRFKTPKSPSNSDFEYEIPQSVSLPDNTICYIDNIVIPNSWKTIDANNNRLYVRTTIYGGPNNQPMTGDRIVLLTPNNYNTTALRAELAEPFKYTNGITVTYDQGALRYDLTCATTLLKIFTDRELTEDNDFQVAYDKTDLKSANELSTIFEPLPLSKTVITGIVNLTRYRNLYISCPTLSDYSTISPSGNYTIVKKVPVNAGYGEITYCNLQATHDHFDVSLIVTVGLWIYGACPYRFP